MEELLDNDKNVYDRMTDEELVRCAAADKDEDERSDKLREILSECAHKFFFLSRGVSRALT